MNKYKYVVPNRVGLLRWRTCAYFCMLMWYITLALATLDLI